MAHDLQIRRLSSADAAAFQRVRLRGLAESPAAFASSHAEEAGTAQEVVAQRLAPRDDSAVFGAFDGGQLIGLIGIRRESMAKLRHKAALWGMYVAPEARRTGAGRALVAQALAFARDELGVRQVNLGVNSANHAAIALYRAAGFEIYGTERASLMIDGQAVDEHHMACRVAAAA